MSALRVWKLSCLLYSCVIFISGAFLIGFGSVLAYKVYIHSRFVPADVLAPFIVLFFVGVCYLLLTWVGIKGPTREHQFYIFVVLVFCFAIFVIELIISIWTFVMWLQLSDEITKEMESSLSGYIQHGYDTRDWILLESRYNCCGVNGPSDYPSGYCSKDEGCKNLYVGDLKSHVIQLMIAGFVICFQSAIGVSIYYVFHKILQEERLKRAQQRRERLRTRPRAISRPPAEIRRSVP